ncbi:MAG TPA: hypothetical protein VNG29_02470 [Candidatus Paceibacterota bacterium]|nr:hypothetical protein [Candidatus Paceibacterota bacterium]
MFKKAASIRRSAANPILMPDPSLPWEAHAAFNPSVVKKDGIFYMLYRAMSAPQKKDGKDVGISSIGIATGKDGVHFEGHRLLFGPTEPWERFGCEDPRITEFEGKFFIFYTAVSEFSAEGIKVAVAITKDLKTIDEKHLVTPFNAKAMALFPERVNGKIAALLTVHTDLPPAKICLALFDRVENLWSESYWRKWHDHLEDHVIGIEYNEKDHVEVGTAPVKTKNGWLFFYSYIYNYFSPPAIFGIQATLLDLTDPQKIVGEVKRPFLVPEEEYELYGRVPNIVFPSGALVQGDKIHLYYGATDTTCCLAIIKLKELLEHLIFTAKRQLARSEKNPILLPVAGHAWEASAVFNPAAIYEEKKVHLLYRAVSADNTSTIGYASLIDGETIAERLPDPVYVPREDFEQKKVAGGNSGCEDPRLTQIGDTIYMCYTAFDGKDPPRVAFTSITQNDFVNHRWNWAKPVLISLPGTDDKDAALFPRKIGGKYIFLHRLGSEIWIDSVKTLDFDGASKFLKGTVLMRPRETTWDSKRIGIACPPIETKYGWLLLYHGISRRTNHYSVRAALLDLKNPSRILYRTQDPLLEPKTDYEKEGVVPNVVFPCGAAVINGRLYVYYGGADKVVGTASIDLKFLLSGLVHESKFHSG